MPRAAGGHQDCTYFDNHTVVAYRSEDLKSFTPRGAAFSASRFGGLPPVSILRKKYRPVRQR